MMVKFTSWDWQWRAWRGKRRIAEDFLDEVFGRKRFGDGSLLVEECLEGPEVSIFAAVSGRQAVVFTPARAYKLIGEGDTGANTGGMGAVAASPARASRAVCPASWSRSLRALARASPAR